MKRSIFSISAVAAAALTVFAIVALVAPPPKGAITPNGPTVSWQYQPAAAATYPPPPPLGNSPFPAALPTSSAVASALQWTYVPSNGSLVSARALAACNFGSFNASGPGIYHNGTTTTVVIVCSNGGILVATSTGF